MERANALLAAEGANAVAFGTHFIANPDLPERFRRNAPLREPERTSFYGGGEAGYTDYPSLDRELAATQVP